jgi:predicted nucleic acid-binding protein
MALVLDSSVTMAWCFEDEACDFTRYVLSRVVSEGARVPLIWQYEVANVLLLGERHSRISTADSAEFLTLLAEQSIEIDDSPPDTALMLLARKHRLTAYDAAYLELSVRKGLPLATLDMRLRKAASEEGLELAGL